jgi:XTP/dITP diphosphohydrolase
MTEKLLLATNNRDKLREYRSLLRCVPFRLVTPEEEGIALEVEETGKSLEENARLKAVAFARESGLLSLADDSGLEVDALGGEPGPLSARYAGEGVSNEERIRFLLGKMQGIPAERRSARFRAIIAIAEPDGEVWLCSGECPGVVTFEPRGEQGFGYDPVFYLPGLDRTMAELPMEAKNNISHRGQAVRRAREVLERITGRRNDRTL